MLFIFLMILLCGTCKSTAVLIYQNLKDHCVLKIHSKNVENKLEDIFRESQGHEYV